MYKEPSSIVFNEDCVEGMKRYPDNFFNLAIVDPEYRDKNQPTKEMRNKIGGKMAWHGKPNKEYFNELMRVSINQIIWGANNFIEHLYSTNCFLFWYKNNPMENYSDGELAWTSFNSVAKCIPIRHYGAHTSDKEIIHPTQKPVKLYKWLLDKYGVCKYCNNEGGSYEDVVGDGGSRMWLDCEECNSALDKSPIILDTHLGSGSSRIAAYEMGFDFIGFEIDKTYYEAQEKRFNDYKKQLKLF